MQDVISRTIIKGCSRPGAEQVRHTLPNSLKILVIFSGLRKFFILMEDEKEKNVFIFFWLIENYMSEEMKSKKEQENVS